MALKHAESDLRSWSVSGTFLCHLLWQDSQKCWHYCAIILQILRGNFVPFEPLLDVYKCKLSVHADFMKYRRSSRYFIKQRLAAFGNCSGIPLVKKTLRNVAHIKVVCNIVQCLECRFIRGNCARLHRWFC